MGIGQIHASDNKTKCFFVVSIYLIIILQDLTIRESRLSDER